MTDYKAAIEEILKKVSDEGVRDNDWTEEGTAELLKLLDQRAEEAYQEGVSNREARSETEITENGMY